MSQNVILDNKFLTLYYHDDKGIVHHVYHPPIGGEALQEGLNIGLDLLSRYQASKWLSDNRAYAQNTEQETEWINTDWLPRAVAAGWKYWALVVPASVKGRMNMNEFVTSFYDMGVRIMVFTDPDEAMRWLERVDQ